VSERKSLQPIPKFDSEDEEREFWATHDSTDYIDWSRAKLVKMPSENVDLMSLCGVLKPSVRGATAEDMKEAARLSRLDGREEAISFPLYERVALKRDIPEHDLRRGDVAVLVDHLPHPEGGEEGYVLEVFNALGESIAVVAVRESEIEALRSDEVLAVRPRRPVYSAPPGHKCPGYPKTAG
jgi:hypothetical protein